MTGHVSLPYKVYIFIFDNAWACSVTVVYSNGWMQDWHASGCRFNSWS